MENRNNQSVIPFISWRTEPALHGMLKYDTLTIPVLHGMLKYHTLTVSALHGMIKYHTLTIPVLHGMKSRNSQNVIL
jgi:hypothetical protein